MRSGRSDLYIQHLSRRWTSNQFVVIGVVGQRWLDSGSTRLLSHRRRDFPSSYRKLHQWNSTVVVRASAVDDDRNETIHSFGKDRSYHLMSTSLPPENVGQDVSSWRRNVHQTNENVSRNYQQTTFNSYTVCWTNSWRLLIFTDSNSLPQRLRAQRLIRISVNSASSLRVLEWHWENTLIVCCWIKASFWLD